jgi:hypothetical protein
MSCLVTAIADDPEQKHARRRGVHLPFRAGRDRPHTRQLTDRITLSDRGVLENACRSASLWAALVWRFRAPPQVGSRDRLVADVRARLVGASAYVARLVRR